MPEPISEIVQQDGPHASDESIERLRLVLVRLDRMLDESQKLLKQLEVTPDPEKVSRLIRDLNVVVHNVTGRRHSFKTVPGALRAMREARDELSKGRDQVERLVAAR